MKLTITLLIKNEVDIIADNIKVHSKLGVDSFVVMDNGSTDGTREVLDQLQKDYDLIIIDRPVLDYQQSNWKTEMAKVARSEQGADWVITNDADCFSVHDGRRDPLGSLVHVAELLRRRHQRAHGRVEEGFCLVERDIAASQDTTE